MASRLVWIGGAEERLGAIGGKRSGLFDIGHLSGDTTCFSSVEFQFRARGWTKLRRRYHAAEAGGI